jgi:hypothetical protein
MKRDMTLLLEASLANKIPLLIGSAGLAGAAPHVEWADEILMEIAKEKDLHFNLAVIRADQDKEYLAERVRANAVTPMAGVPPLNEEMVASCEHLVAQMGVEPFIEALDRGAQVVLAGRACDSAIFAAYPVRQGFDPGLALHMGKILECGALAAIPPTGRDCLIGRLSRDRFQILAPNPIRKVTPLSAAAHMVYEVENPYLQGEPSGLLDFSNVLFEQEGETTIVRGTKFTPHENPTLRFEGAALVGYRSFVLGGIRDPFLIAQIDEYARGCEEQTRRLLPGCDFRIDWIFYGRDGVMGKWEPRPLDLPHEIGVLAQVMADNQELAHDVAALLEARMIGFAYSGAKTRTAHVAFPFSPIVNDTGAVYRFNVLHIATLRNPKELVSLFPIEMRKV